MADQQAPEAAATHVYRKDDWEVTYEADDVNILTEDMEVGEVMEIGRLQELPSEFAACVPTALDDEGNPEDWEVQYFPTLDAARAALSKAQPADGEGQS